MCHSFVLYFLTCPGCEMFSGTLVMAVIPRPAPPISSLHGNSLEALDLDRQIEVTHGRELSG